MLLYGLGVLMSILKKKTLQDKNLLLYLYIKSDHKKITKKKKTLFLYSSNSRHQLFLQILFF